MISIMLLLPFNMAMYTEKGTKGLIEETSRIIEKFEGELEPSVPP